MVDMGYERGRFLIYLGLVNGACCQGYLHGCGVAGAADTMDEWRRELLVGFVLIIV